MRIAVDVMGGEKPPEELIAGCIDAVNQWNDVNVVLVGRRERIESALSHIKDVPSNRIDIVHAEQVVAMKEDPMSAFKNKKASSITVGLRLLKEGVVDGFFSPGNTGAVVLSTALIIGRLKQVRKPALAVTMPTRVKDKYVVVLDVGANPTVSPADLVQFAVMGAVFSEDVLGHSNPSVGLLNIGEEEYKGHDIVKETHQALKEIPINYIGNIEGRDIMSGEVDVVVCDGFVGNIVLKLAESVAGFVIDIIKEKLKGNIAAMLSYPFIKPSFKRVKKHIDPAKHGAAPLLGVKSTVTIGHGISNREAVKNAIRVTTNMAKKHLEGRIAERLESTGAIFKETIRGKLKEFILNSRRKK